MASLDQCHHLFHRHVLFRERHIDVWLVTLDNTQGYSDTSYDIFQQGKIAEPAFFHFVNSKLKRVTKQ